MSEAVLYVGTFPRAYRTDVRDVAFGVHAFGQDLVSGELRSLGVAPTPRPGWVAVHPSGRYVYALNEVRSVSGAARGSVTAFSADPSTGVLRELGRAFTGASPCHATVDATGSVLLVASFHGGAVQCLPIGTDGRLGAARELGHRGSGVHPRQDGPHPHAVVLDRQNRFVFVPDMGTDRVEVHELDAATATLIPRPSAGSPVPAGSGPRHLVQHPDGHLVFCLNEITATIESFAFDETTGALTWLGTTAVLPPDYTGYRSGAEILLSPSGRHLYVTHRSHGSSGPRPEGGLDCVSWFRVDTPSGRLTLHGQIPSGGNIPRSCTLDPTGSRLLIAHQASSSIVTFAVDPGTGDLRPTELVTRTPVPVCLQFAPTPAPASTPVSSADPDR